MSTFSCIIIDDDYDLVESCTDSLKFYGIDVLGTGYNGKEALELYQKVNPDIVFLDMNMPKYDGFYAIDEIRKIDPYAKIIVVTANMSESMTEKIKSKNCPVINKPFSFNELLDTAKK